MEPQPLEELIDSIRRIHEISDNLSGNASAAMDTALAVQSSVSGLGVILERSRQKTAELLSSSEKIVEVLNFLRGLIDSTHVLGINASILAASAGKAGAGFAVVSHELRKLAKDSAASLKNIEGIVQGLESSIRTVGGEILASSEALDNQKTLLASVGGHLQGTVLGLDVIHSASGQSLETAATILQTGVS